MKRTVREKLESTFKNIRLLVPEDDRVLVTAENNNVHTLLRFLKDEGFGHLALVSAVDWIENDIFELCYILTSYEQDESDSNKNGLHIILKTKIPRKEPEFETITSIFPNAEPYEREIYELFGIKFEGHKRLIPLLLEREYTIPPFRKDFDTRKYVEGVFQKIPFVEDKDK
ncbi:MAG: NADH-quinone oxidoreductase subunit C [Deltaproteobacteria bacterium]|nr:NADH-quinone oxidoreductase subunit C [Deltaproteobacteria bacterium]